MTSKLRPIVDLVTTLLMISASVAVLWAVATKNRSDERLETNRPVALAGRPISMSGAHFLGRDNARRLLVIYSDFRCPFCLRFATDAWPTVKTQFADTGKLRIAFHNYPIERLHPEALGDAVGAVCAGRQGKFWEMHDSLFFGSNKPHSIHSIARTIDVENPSFEACVADDGVVAAIRAEVKDASALGVSGTPAFVLGEMDSNGGFLAKVLVNGYQTLPDLVKMLERFVSQTLN